MTFRTLAIIAALLPAALDAQEKATAQSKTSAQGRTTVQGQSKTTAQGKAGAPEKTTTQEQPQAATPRARIDAAVQAAAEADIPVSLLKSKVAEGEAKRVSEERIAAAVEGRLRALVRASSTLERADVEQRGASELAVAADALQAGVSESALVRVTKSAPESRRVVAIAVLADLVRLGKPSDAALAQVTAAVTSSAALASLNAQVASQLRLGGLTSTLDAAGIVRVP